MRLPLPYQYIAQMRGTAAVVDYSVLYDDVIRATLWEEVTLSVIPPSALGLHYFFFLL